MWKTHTQKDYRLVLNNEENSTHPSSGGSKVAHKNEGFRIKAEECSYVAVNKGLQKWTQTKSQGDLLAAVQMLNVKL